jgi:uncharacterized repeat protein (TIGR03806 family)
MRLLLSAVAAFGLAVAAAQAGSDQGNMPTYLTANPPTLSAFGFFDGSAKRPAASLIPYALKTPLFSDYAGKQRFIHLPEGTRITAAADGTLVFPVGTVLIKTFGYAAGPHEALETRLLVHRADGWTALPYVWRKDGSDADLRVGGTRLPVTFQRPDGQQMTISYAVPNKNQCKQCHSSAEAIMPIGPKWQNMTFARAADRARIASDNPHLAKLSPSPDWADPKSGSLEARASSYLAVNCGHCHSPKGSASNSGLFLDGSARDAAALGIGKRPVAAGRASGNLDFIVEAGKPDRSIIIARMKSVDPGIAMPELGRATVHEEGVRLLQEWIAAMPSDH